MIVWKTRQLVVRTCSTADTKATKTTDLAANDALRRLARCYVILLMTGSRQLLRIQVLRTRSA